MIGMALASLADALTFAAVVPDKMSTHAMLREVLCGIALGAGGDACCRNGGDFNERTTRGNATGENLRRRP
jgi:hypothetical protein